jgi:transposase
VTKLLRKYHARSGETIRVVCALNEGRARFTEQRRQQKIAALALELDRVLAGNQDDRRELRMERVFEGHNRRYRRFFRWERDDVGTQPTGYQLGDDALAAERKYDGVFMLATTRQDLSPKKVVESYKNLQEVETLFDDLKHFVDIHPVRHWLEVRVRAHVFLCILALLLKRVLETDCLKSRALTETLETIATSKLIRYRVRMSPRSPQTRTFWKVTTLTPQQASCFAVAGVKNPQSLEPYTW